jgi:hypothetical protein
MASRSFRLEVIRQIPKHIVVMVVDAREKKE